MRRILLGAFAAVLIASFWPWHEAKAETRAFSFVPYITKPRAYTDGHDSIVIDMVAVGQRCNLPDPDGTRRLTDDALSCPGGNDGGWVAETVPGVGFSMGSDFPYTTFNRSWYVTGSNGHVQVLAHSTQPGYPAMKLFLDKAHTQWYADMGGNTYFDLVPTPPACPAGNLCLNQREYQPYNDPDVPWTNLPSPVRLLNVSGPNKPASGAAVSGTNSSTGSASATPVASASVAVESEGSGEVAGAATQAPSGNNPAKTSQPAHFAAAGGLAAWGWGGIIAIGLLGLGLVVGVLIRWRLIHRAK